jgi:hypothetical protein
MMEQPSRPVEAADVRENDEGVIVTVIAGNLKKRLGYDIHFKFSRRCAEC